MTAETRIQALRDLVEAGRFDVGEAISAETHEQILLVLGSTLIDGEQVISPTAEQILDERLRQVNSLGYSPGVDEARAPELLAAARCYIRAAINPKAYKRTAPLEWPWPGNAWKPGPPHEMLVKAGALTAAAGDELVNAGDR